MGFSHEDHGIFQSIEECFKCFRLIDIINLSTLVSETLSTTKLSKQLLSLREPRPLQVSLVLEGCRRCVLSVRLQTTTHTEYALKIVERIDMVEQKAVVKPIADAVMKLLKFRWRLGIGAALGPFC